MRKHDEIKFYGELMRRALAGEESHPRAVARELGINETRALRLCEKWCDKGWLDFGVTPLAGFFTPERAGGYRALRRGPSAREVAGGDREGEQVRLTAALAKTFWPEERQVLRPPDELTVSEWADKYRVLEPETHAHPGRWLTDFGPYLRGIMDAYCRVPELVLMGSTQWGKTETAINCLLYTIDQDQAPTLFVLPTEGDVLSFVERRLKNAIDHCPEVARHRTSRKADWKGGELGFDGMTLYFAWSNSASKLASKSIGRLFLDEVDKYPAFAGRESDPISLATERQRWWHDYRRVISSTPTTPNGYIWQHWQESDQRWFHVPCPFCGTFQKLLFNRDTVQWPADERDPERIREGRLAHYVCQHCEKPIPDDDDHKRRMLLAGVWCPEAGHVDRRGRVRGASLDAKKQGFHVNSLYSPMLAWSDVAAQFLLAKDDTAKLMNFTNSWLGWPWLEKESELDADVLRGRQTALPAGTVPPEAVILTAGVDVQADWLYYAIRAHGVGERSVTIAANRVERWNELAAALFHSAYPVHDVAGKALPIRLACIDSGYRTDEVYQFCAEYPDVARPTKGHDQRAVPLSGTKVERDWLGRSGGMMLWHVDTGYFKDKLARQMHTQQGSPGCWNVHAFPTDEYLQQVTAEHKVLVRSKSTKQVAARWVPRIGAGGNHWWDCEVLNVAAADMLGLYVLRDDTTDKGVATYKSATDAGRPPREAERERERRQEQREGGKRKLGKRPGWIRRKGQR